MNRLTDSYKRYHKRGIRREIISIRGIETSYRNPTKPKCSVTCIVNKFHHNPHKWDCLITDNFSLYLIQLLFGGHIRGTMRCSDANGKQCLGQKI